MSDRATSQADNVVPPRRGQCAAVSVDTTARPYDLTGLAFANNSGNAFVPTRKEHLYITLSAEGGNIFYHFHTATASDLDNTAIGAVGTLALASAAGAILPAGSQVDLRIDRNVDKFLIVKTSASTATLRIWPSSQSDQ